MIRRHASLVVACTVAGVISALVLVWQTPRTYESHAEIFVAATHTASSGGVYDRARFAQERVKSYVPLVTNARVLTAVANDLGLGRTVTELAAEVTVRAIPDTVLLAITVQDGSASRAQAIANGIATQFVSFATQLEGTDEGTPAVGLSVTKPAELSSSPSSPRTNVDLLAGLFVGLMVGLVTAALRQRWSSHDDPADELRVTRLMASQGDSRVGQEVGLKASHSRPGRRSEA